MSRLVSEFRIPVEGDEITLSPLATTSWRHETISYALHREVSIELPHLRLQIAERVPRPLADAEVERRRMTRATVAGVAAVVTFCAFALAGGQAQAAWVFLCGLGTGWLLRADSPRAADGYRPRLSELPKSPPRGTRGVPPKRTHEEWLQGPPPTQRDHSRGIDRRPRRLAWFLSRW